MLSDTRGVWFTRLDRFLDRWEIVCRLRHPEGTQGLTDVGLEIGGHDGRISTPDGFCVALRVSTSAPMLDLPYGHLGRTPRSL